MSEIAIAVVVAIAAPCGIGLLIYAMSRSTKNQKIGRYREFLLFALGACGALLCAPLTVLGDSLAERVVGVVACVVGLALILIAVTVRRLDQAR